MVVCVCVTVNGATEFGRERCGVCVCVCVCVCVTVNFFFIIFIGMGVGNNKKGTTTKEYFPTVLERLKMKINPTQHLMTLVKGHGNIKSYLHRFRITEAPDCPCGNGNQTAEHILLECGILQEERERPIAAVVKTHYKAFAEFTKTVDKIKELNTL